MEGRETQHITYTYRHCNHLINKKQNIKTNSDNRGENSILLHAPVSLSESPEGTGVRAGNLLSGDLGRKEESP